MARYPGPDFKAAVQLQSNKCGRNYIYAAGQGRTLRGEVKIPPRSAVLSPDCTEESPGVCLKYLTTRDPPSQVLMQLAHGKVQTSVVLSSPSGFNMQHGWEPQL